MIHMGMQEPGATKSTSSMNINQRAPTRRKARTGAYRRSMSNHLTMVDGNDGKPTTYTTIQYNTMILDGSGIHTTNNKSKGTMAPRNGFLETPVGWTSRKAFVSPSRTSASSCGPSTRTSAGPSCTCGQSPGQEGRPGWGRSAGSRWRAGPGTSNKATHMSFQHNIIVRLKENCNWFQLERHPKKISFVVFHRIANAKQKAPKWNKYKGPSRVWSCYDPIQCTIKDVILHMADKRTVVSS